MGQPAFTGDVALESIAEVTVAPVNVSSVSFHAGAVTHWHAHQGGQVLVVVRGTARYQERGGAVREFRPGERVVASPEVEHWHGAAPGDSMVHISIASGQTSWGEAPEVP